MGSYILLLFSTFNATREITVYIFHLLSSTCFKRHRIGRNVVDDVKSLNNVIKETSAAIEGSRAFEMAHCVLLYVVQDVIPAETLRNVMLSLLAIFIIRHRASGTLA